MQIFYRKINHFYLRKLDLHHFIGKSPRGRAKFSWILEYSLMPIIVQKQILLTSLYFGENLPNWPSIVDFYLRKLEICTILSENHQEGVQIIFIDIRVLLNTNNRTETDFADEPLVWRKSAQLAVYWTFLFKEIGHLHHFIGKSPRGRANHFHRY